ncbi:MAG TPA: YdcF family protein [Beijerinckiaceae bacterium]|nr:YdcF family protein [Beijerinckiaceae bacterium]
MFYYTAKVLWFLATPSNLLPALGGLGVVLMLTRLRRMGLALGLLGTFGVLAAGLSPLATLVILPLEERFPAFRDDGAEVAGIVVLGGAIEAEESLARAQLTVNEAGERVIALADLARRHPAARILFSGGAGALLTDEPPEAEVLSRFAETLGVARERLVLETRSRSTRENALFSQALAGALPGERWLLVTSGWHMPRAIGAFRQAGFPVTAYPVDYRTRGPQDRRRPFAFAANGLRRLDIATKEWIGLLAYRLAGYTDALLPGPEDAGRPSR